MFISPRNQAPPWWEPHRISKLHPLRRCENIERDECIDAFNKHITSHCCYGRHPLSAVNQISVKKTHIYKVEILV